MNSSKVKHLVNDLFSLLKVHLARNLTAD